jgi:dTDP-4-amino-4,6-dideoxygalactose transaminase
MANLPPEKQQRLEEIEASLHRMALKVLEVPRSDREAVYEVLRESFAETRRILNIGDKEAADFEANYMTWLRALVSIIERGGGAGGGKA